MAEERVLRFGNLDDIIYVREFEIILLKGNFKDLEKENYEWMEEFDCSGYPSCKRCSSKKYCEVFMKNLYDGFGAINAEIDKIGREMHGLLAEQMFTQSVFRGQPPI